MIENSYVGKKAENYNAKREHTNKWRLEHKAVDKLLPKTGSVLDVPVGTGRFLPLYADRGMTITGIDTSADMLCIANDCGVPCQLMIGNILRLAFAEKAFDVSVCIRLSNWFSIDDVKKSIEQLIRVSEYVIYGIRTGPESKQKGRLRVHANHEFREILITTGVTINKAVPIDGKGYVVYRLCV